MTDNEIIKALECCVKDDEGVRGFCNKGCPLFGKGEDCPEFLRRNALDLINRQKAEIERLKDYNENLLSANTALSNEILEIRTEAIKEFAERLKKAFPSIAGAIDYIKKEMVGDNNE